MTQPYLRPVGPTDNVPPGDDGRAQARQRANKSFPSDRMKMDRQIAALGALGRLSGPRKEPVNGNDLAKAVGGVSPGTVVLSNKFFADAGWIASSGKGLYSATDALVEYTRRLAVDSSAQAIKALQEPMRRAWFWGTLEPHFSNGKMRINEAAIVLMREADASDSHMPQITNLITWLEHVGLVTVQDGLMTAVEGQVTPIAQESSPADQSVATGPASTETRTAGEEPTQHAGNVAPAPVIAFSFDVKMTADDLAQLSPEQIQAFFQAVGTVAAVTSKL